MTKAKTPPTKGARRSKGAPRPSGSSKDFAAAVKEVERANKARELAPIELKLAANRWMAAAARAALAIAPPDVEEHVKWGLEATLYVAKENVKQVAREYPEVAHIDPFGALTDAHLAELTAVSPKVRAKTEQVLGTLDGRAYHEWMAASDADLGRIQRNLAELLEVLPKKKAPTLSKTLWELYEGISAMARQRARGHQRVARIPVQFEVYENGITLLVIGREGHGLGGCLIPGVQVGYVQEMNGQQAEEMANALSERLRTGLWSLLRPAQGGARKRGHGLSTKRLRMFAQAVERELKDVARGKRAEVRQRVAERFGIPPAYGGAARDKALRDLVLEGQRLRGVIAG